MRLPTQEDVRRAKQIMAQAKGPAMHTLEEIYARERVLLSEYPAKVAVIVQAVGIGDLGIAVIPCEVFVEIGLELKQKSPFDTTFTVSLANGYNGYLPTVEHRKLGGYERPGGPGPATWRSKPHPRSWTSC